MNRLPNDQLVVVLSKYVQRDISAPKEYYADVKLLRWTPVETPKGKEQKLTEIASEGIRCNSQTFDNLAERLIANGVILRPDRDDLTTTNEPPRFSYLYDGGSKVPLTLEELYGFERRYYNIAVKRFGDAAKGDPVLVKLA